MSQSHTFHFHLQLSSCLIVVCLLLGSMVTHCDESPGSSCSVRTPVIFNPDFFVEKLRHENPEAFLELVLSNITRLIDLPGTEFAQLLGEDCPKTPTSGNGGFFRSFNFLKRKGKNHSRHMVTHSREKKNGYGMSSKKLNVLDFFKL